LESSNLGILSQNPLTQTQRIDDKVSKADAAGPGNAAAMLAVFDKPFKRLNFLIEIRDFSLGEDR
jgi:hypothetical protein